MYDLQVLGSKAERESMRVQGLAEESKAGNTDDAGDSDDDAKPLLVKSAVQSEATVSLDDTPVRCRLSCAHCVF
jgi:hypothetical protein